MKNKQILEHLNKSINDAPINILDNLKNIQVVKMTEHDEITSQNLDTSDSQNTITSKKSTLFNYKPLISLASFAAVFLFIFIGIWQFRMPDSQIYLDVNPSIQITTNRRDKVIALKAINTDSIKIIENIKYKDKDLSYVTDEVITGLALDYLTGEPSNIDEDKDVMLISVYNKDFNKSDNQAEEIDSLVRNKLESYNFDSIVLTQTIDKSNTVEQYADEYGLSVGKMTFIRNLIILDPSFKTEELIDLSLYELLELSINTGIDIDSIIDNKGDKDITIESSTKAPSNDTTEGSTETKTEETIKETIEESEAKTVEPATKEPNIETQRPTRKLITLAKAKEIALGRTKGGRVIDAEYDDDDYKYEIEIINNGYEYDVEVDGYTGEVIGFDRDEVDDDDYLGDDYDSSQNASSKTLIGIDKAKKIALARTKGGRVVDTEYDDDDYKYEIEIINGIYEYEVEIDAYTGEVTDFDEDEIDDDD